MKLLGRVNAELRIVDRLAIGLQPFYTMMDGSFDSGSDFGIALYLRWKFLDSGRWALSLYPAIGYESNSAESDGQVCGPRLT